MNTIVDYTLYWFQAIAEDYQYTGTPPSWWRCIR